MMSVPQSSHDLSALNAPTQAAVFIELSFGSRPDKPHTKRDFADLGRRLADTVETENVGAYAGNVVIAESMTLIFYGADAEALFRAAEPSLMSEPMCAGRQSYHPAARRAPGSGRAEPINVRLMSGLGDRKESNRTAGGPTHV